MLLNGSRFDLNIAVVLMSVKPLVLYYHRQSGPVCRQSTERFAVVDKNTRFLPDVSFTGEHIFTRSLGARMGWHLTIQPTNFDSSLSHLFSQSWDRQS
jgi:hypothetical protein